tara:strand:- start:286 stop:483 length:198 start_codon:yes stop_codon:yes gene_type:complete
MKVDDMVGKKYRHVKSGRVYTVTAIGNSYSPSLKFPLTVIYESEHAVLWCRPFSQFINKFVGVSR